MSNGLINVSGVRNMVTLPAYIFDDNRVSLGAKGIFVQIYYSKDSILALSDITKLSNSTEDEIQKYINELIDLGYIEEKKGIFNLRQKALSSRTIEKKENSDEVKSAIKSTVVTPVPKKNKFEFIRDRVMASDLPPSVKELLVDYFVKWLNGEDRFAVQELHKNMVDGRINSLISLRDENSLKQEDLEKCVKQSIENHWFKFIWPLVNKSSQFDRSALVSGSYTPDEIEEIKRKAQKRLEAYSDE